MALLTPFRQDSAKVEDSVRILFEIFGKVEMRSQKRYFVSNLICRYLCLQNTTRVEITARDIVDYYQLPTTYCYSVSALLKRVFDNGIRDPRYGFYVVKTRDMKKYKKPRHYTIELISPGQKQTEAHTRS